MTKEEVLTLVGDYHKAHRWNTEFALQHLWTMLPKMEEMEDVEKLMRWLGFIQGVLWAKQVYTLEALKKHNKYGYWSTKES